MYSKTLGGQIYQSPLANTDKKKGWGEGDHFNQLSECDLLNAREARLSARHIKIGLIFFAEKVPHEQPWPQSIMLKAAGA